MPALRHDLKRDVRQRAEANVALTQPCADDRDRLRDVRGLNPVGCLDQERRLPVRERVDLNPVRVALISDTPIRSSGPTNVADPPRYP